MMKNPEKLGRRLRIAVLNAVASLIPSKLARIRANQKSNRSLARHYGDLRSDAEWKSLSVKGLENESSQIFGLVVQTIKDIEQPVDSLLLAGEAAAAKPMYSSIANIAREKIKTAGLHAGADHMWNFEESPPDMGRFHCIVSHAILEHLIDPYGHFRALCDLLLPGGHLVIFTVTPGFPYHRYPIDCMRFSRTGSKRWPSGQAWKSRTVITVPNGSCTGSASPEGLRSSVSFNGRTNLS